MTDARPARSYAERMGGYTQLLPEPGYIAIPGMPRETWLVASQKDDGSIRYNIVQDPGVKPVQGRRQAPSITFTPEAFEALVAEGAEAIKHVTQRADATRAELLEQAEAKGLGGEANRLMAWCAAGAISDPPEVVLRRMLAAHADEPEA